ncbi:MAG: hypothetical protein ACK5JD_06270 [Mangrovibacterium sp.]
MDTKLLSTDRPVAVYYAFLHEIDSITRIDNSHCSVVLSGTGWKIIRTTIGTIDLQEKPSATGAGTLYVTNLSATCPGHDDNTPSDIKNLAGRPLLLRIDYRSGLQKVIGTKTTGPKLLIDTLSSTTTSRKIQSSYKTNQPNWWLG